MYTFGKSDITCGNKPVIYAVDIQLYIQITQVW